MRQSPVHNWLGSVLKVFKVTDYRVIKLKFTAYRLDSENRKTVLSKKNYPQNHTKNNLI